ncbi:MAG: hypothetical protein WCK49_06710 [Myxococcaceae bacterium]
MNDKYGPGFLNYLTRSLDITDQQDSNLWDMNLLNLEETLEKPNFFVSKARRARAVRYFGYFSNSTVNASLLQLWDLAQKAAPAEPEVVADRTLNQMIWGTFWPLGSFSFWQFLEHRKFLKDRYCHLCLQYDFFDIVLSSSAFALLVSSSIMTKNIHDGNLDIQKQIPLTPAEHQEQISDIRKLDTVLNVAYVATIMSAIEFLTSRFLFKAYWTPALLNTFMMFWSTSAAFAYMHSEQLSNAFDSWIVFRIANFCVPLAYMIKRCCS